MPRLLLFDSYMMRRTQLSLGCNCLLTWQPFDAQSDVLEVRYPKHISLIGSALTALLVLATHSTQIRSIRKKLLNYSRVAQIRPIVIAPASTGKESSNKKAVIKTAHTIRGNLCIVIPGALILKIVVMKFIAPKIEEAPDKCKLKMAKSTEGPECA